MRKICTLIMLTLLGSVAAMAQMPVIHSAEVIRTDVADNRFTLAVNVKYSDADRVRVMLYIDNYEGVNVTDWYEEIYNEDGLAKFSSSLKIPNSYIGRGWIREFTVYATNSAGTTELDLEVPLADNSAIDDLAVDGGAVESIELIDLRGVTVYRGTPQGFNPGNIPSGVYVRKATATDGKVTSSKVIIK